MSLRTITRLLAVVFVFVAATPWLFAGSIGLAWDPSSGATGYRVHYGPDPNDYNTTIDVGNVTEVVVTGAPDCVDSHYAVSAYNSAGESGFSNEVRSWPRPTVDDTSPDSAMQGAVLTLTVNGNNIQSGSTVETDNPNVVLGTSATGGCDEVQISATVEPTAGGVQPAEIGSFSVTVTGPDGAEATATDVFDVLINPERFNVVDDPGPSEDRLDGRDTIWISRLFGSKVGDASYDPDSDFDGDGWVDGRDLAYLAGNLGKCWSGSTWTISACPSSLR